MPTYVDKNMRYVHIAEICEKCDNMRQSHIRIKLTCLKLPKLCGVVFAIVRLASVKPNCDRQTDRQTNTIRAHNKTPLHH